MKLRIQHRTIYRYAENVAFGPHRMMLRPREGHDIHIEQSVLEIAPAHHIRWIRDVYGNSIAVVDFSERASELAVYSEVILNHFESNPFNFYIEPEAVRYPFSYLPGGGWKGFDPTLGLMATSQHVAVAVSRHPENAMPISGSFLGSGSAFLHAEVHVRVEETGSQPASSSLVSRQAQFAHKIA